MGRVVYVLRAFPEPSETFIRNEIRALRRLGTPITVVTAERSSPAAPDWTAEDERSVPVIVLDDPGLPSIPPTLGTLGLGPRAAVRVGRLAARARQAAKLLPRDTEVLHAHFANDAAVLAREIAARTDLPYRVTAHAYDLYQDPLLLEENLGKAARVLTISEANASFIRTHLPGLDNVEVLRCGIDLERFAYRDPPEPGSPAMLLCVARLIPKKGHGVLLDAIAALRSSGADVTLSLAGTGPLEPELRARVAALDVVGAVKLLGNLAHGEVMDEMRRSDAVVLAARVAEDGDRDGIPVALMEAMALGVPVISTSVSGVPELITPGTGLLVPPDDSDALADAIKRTIELPAEKRRDQARAARAQIDASYDIEKIARELRP